MAGRDPIIGEIDPYLDTRSHEKYLNRLVRGQLSDVNNIDGSANLETIEVVGTRKVTVPPLWFSSKTSNPNDPNAAGRTAWGRYMPLGDELVEVGYRNDGSAVILGYNIDADEQGLNRGWSFLRQKEEEKQLGFVSFRKLKGGEFDFKSSGDAYIHGSNQGVLTLFGGQAFIKLDKFAYRTTMKASEFNQISETTFTKFGTVFRKLAITDQDEQPVPPGTFKEFLVDVNQALPTGTPSPQSKAVLHFGDILNIANIPEIGPAGAALRGRISIGDAANATEVFSMLIDQLGNIEWKQGNLGVQGLTMIMQTIDIEAALTAKFNGSSIIIGGATAAEPLVLGTALITALTELVNTVFVQNAAQFGIGNLGSPVPLNPAVILAFQQWLTTHVTGRLIVSNKAFTEKG